MVCNLPQFPIPTFPRQQAISRNVWGAKMKASNLANLQLLILLIEIHLILAYELTIIIIKTMSRLNKIITTSLLGFTSIGCLLYAATNEKKEGRPQEAVKIQYKKRSDHLRDISAKPEYDVVVIGGGCNGVGVLLDASTRGLRTLLIEKDDFASGASSKSTKLIHGGVRYLQQVFELSLDSISSRIEKFQLVKEAIAERSMMIDSAPHLTTKIPFVIPCTNLVSATYYYIGSLFYYLIYALYSPSTPTSFNMPYFMNRLELTQIFPHMNPKYTMGVVYEDGSFNDARLLLTALLTATIGNGFSMPECFKPASALNRAQFINFVKDSTGKITGVTFRDAITQKEYRVKAKYVVNCTGAWSDRIRLLDNPEAKKRMCIVAGSHITYDKRVSSPDFGICAPSPDGRIILVVPWLSRVIAGTTEHKLQEPTNNPTCTGDQRKFINKTLFDIMSEMNIEEFMNSEKVRWCGLRPLVVEDASSQTKKISRNHVIEESDNGLLSLMGGKWTTYRKMGEELVDIIVKKEKEQGKDYPESQTKGLPLLGSASEAVKSSLIKEAGDIGAQLYRSFGSEANRIKKGNISRLYGSTTVAELEWIVKNQLVTDVEDVLLRRTRLSFLVGKSESLSLAYLIGDLLQKQLGWSKREKERRVKESIERILTYEFE